MEIISRSQAKIIGSTFYYTGKTYKCGHDSPRYVSSKGCVACSEETRIKWNNNNRERTRIKSSEWARANRSRKNASTMRYKAAKLQATPSWADLKAIQVIYDNCPEGHHVDHYYPLRSDWVCGLHVENNLQYLTASDNCSKQNKKPRRAMLDPGQVFREVKG